MKKTNIIVVALLLMMLYYQKCYISIEKLPCKNCLFQDKQKNCGPTALKMVFNDFNINLDLAQIEQETNFQRTTGVTLLDLYNYSEKIGLKPKALRISSESLKGYSMPCLIFIKDSHFAIIDSVNTEGYCFLRDPARGRLKISLSRLTKMWHGEILVFQQ